MLKQYIIEENRYFPKGELKPAGVLPPGYYDVCYDDYGQMYMEARKLETDALLVLPDTVSDEIVTEVARFWTLADRFARYGFVHKRGYLMYGPPGAGKTSTIALIARQMVHSKGIILNGSCGPGRLLQAMCAIKEIEPGRGVVVMLEDFDEMVRRNETEWLAILDGDASVPGVAFIATTNYVERMSDRIVNRPSRFDRVVKIDMPSAAARRIYLRHCDPYITDEEVETWTALTEGFSVAQRDGVKAEPEAAEEEEGDEDEGSPAVPEDPFSRGAAFPTKASSGFHIAVLEPKGG